MGKGRFGTKLKLDERAEFNGDPPFMLIPPKPSSNTDEGDCPSQWFEGDLAWLGFDAEKESLKLLGKNGRPVVEKC